MIHRRDIQIRDPFVVAEQAEGRYYLFGTTDLDPWNSRGSGFNAYCSTDLEHFEGPFRVFSAPEGFWGTHDFWAPEIHAYRGRFYCLATFTSPESCRGTQVLVSDSILGPYLPLVERALTPADMECLDGTLYIDSRNTPWLVFCHEWVQAYDGAVMAMPLTPDLRESAGDPRVLFRASGAPWSRPLERRDGSGRLDAYVTDGPFMYRQSDGRLIMLWSSIGESGYVMGCAVSDSGSISGSWRQAARPIICGDGGHGMFFRDFSGRLLVTFHSPNTTPDERFRYHEVKESPDGPILSGKVGSA